MDSVPIYSHPVNSINQVRPLLEQYPDAQTAIDAIERISIPQTHTIVRQPLEATDPFKIAFCGSWGFSTHQEVEACSHTYLNIAISCFFEISQLSGLIVDALECHRAAYDQFANFHDPKLALESMCEAEETAKALSHGYMMVSNKIRCLNRITKLVYFHLCINGQTLLNEKKPPSPSKARTLVEMKLNALEASVVAFIKINRMAWGTV